jgi:hypothetical protein
MARVHSSRSVTMSLIYNIDQPVGPGCPNRPDDVTLVQYLLKIAHDGRSQLVEVNNWANFVPPRPMMLDGIFGDITHAYIKRYYAGILHGAQMPGTNAGPAIVHPARSFAIQNTGILGIMVMLNIHFQKLRPAEYLHLGVALDLPSKLANSPICFS